jgi:hypothetical protein
MKKNFKKALQNAFEPPMPLRKNEFLKTIPQPKTSMISFMLTQAEYLPKHVWWSSTLIGCIALFGAYFLKNDVLGIVSTVIPFAAVSVITENIRSDIYMMSELEMAAQFSLKSVVLARMGILGVLHLILLLFLIPLSSFYNVASVLQTGLYLLVPYLLTITIGLWVTRKVRVIESMYVCIGISACISGINFFVQTIFPIVYEEKYLLNWILILIILIILTIRELKKDIRQTEELIWNLL